MLSSPPLKPCILLLLICVPILYLFLDFSSLSGNHWHNVQFHFLFFPPSFVPVSVGSHVHFLSSSVDFRQSTVSELKTSCLFLCKGHLLSAISFLQLLFIASSPCSLPNYHYHHLSPLIPSSPPDIPLCPLFYNANNIIMIIYWALTVY